MTSQRKAILFTAALAALLIGGVAFTLLVRIQRPPAAALAAASANAGAPLHHTVTIVCPNTVTNCLSGRITIQTSDGGSSQMSFQMGGGTTADYTFTGLSGGGSALDLVHPKVTCTLGGDSTTIPMGPGATVAGAPLTGSFTVPAGIAATVTIYCQ